MLLKCSCFQTCLKGGLVHFLLAYNLHDLNQVLGCFRYRIRYVETSAVTGQGLEAGMNALLRMVMPTIESQIESGLRTKR